jgi:hypothetical protein
LRETLPAQKSPQESFGGAAIASGIFAESFIARACGENTGGFEHDARFRKMKQFRFARFHLVEERRARFAGAHTARE